MRRFGEFLGALKAEIGTQVQYSVGGRGGYFQNVRAIDEFSDTSVVFRGRKSSLRVEGEGLALEKYYAGDAELSGEIRRVELLPPSAPLKRNPLSSNRNPAPSKLTNPLSSNRDLEKVQRAPSSGQGERGGRG